jgi:hypothetical protein
MKFRLIAVLAAACVLTACVSTKATMLASVERPTPEQMLQPEQIVIFRSADQVGKPYKEIAILSSTGDSTLTDMAAFYRSMQSQAAQLGANAVILGTTKEPSTGAEVASWIFGTPANRKSESYAILVEGLAPLPAKAKKK